MSDLPENSPADSSAKARCWALIPCAGMGSRMGLDGPKQYQSLAGKPMVLHTLAAFAEVSRISSVLVVVSPGDSFYHRTRRPGALLIAVAPVGRKV